MVRPRTTRARGTGCGVPTLVKGGGALKQAIHVARARAGITSDIQLALKAGVSYDTLMNWYGERTVPRPHELKKVADALGASYADLIAVYEGTALEPQPIEDALRDLIRVLTDLVAELRLTRAEQVEATETVMAALGALGRGPARAGRRADTEREAPAGSAQ